MIGKKPAPPPRYPGRRAALDGNSAVIAVERESSDAAGAYPITPSTQMGEYWSEAAAAGHVNVSGRGLVFIEPESEHAAAAVTAGMAMTGLRATNFSSAQGVAFMHESLYAAAGKHLPYVLNMGCRAITKASLNVHCAHDDYHCVDDTGFIQLMAASAQEAADLNLIGRRVAEAALLPAVVGQDGFLTTHLIESMQVPERELVAEFLGRPDDTIDCPTPAQRLLYGARRRRVPLLWDVDNPVASGPVQNQDAYMQAVAAQRPYFAQHVPALADAAMAEYAALTGRRYARVATYRCDDAEYLILGMGSMVVQAQAVADWLRAQRRVKVGVVNLTMYRPFPGGPLGRVLAGRRGVAVLERTDQPLAEDLPLMREVRAVIAKCLENGREAEPLPHPGYPAWRKSAEAPRLYSGCYGLGSRDLQPADLVGVVENMLPEGAGKRFFYLSIDFAPTRAETPAEELRRDTLAEAYPDAAALAVHGSENPDLMPAEAISVRMHSVGGWGAMTTGKNLALTLFELLGYHIKANPKYGSEKKGQPTTYYLAVAPEPIRLNCELQHVDVVLSPDPKVFERAAPLVGLGPGGILVLQSSAATDAEAWAAIPAAARATIVERGIRVYVVDGFRIAREEASRSELQFRMQGNAFQGAFFAATGLMERAGLDEAGLFAAIEAQLGDKFGAKGARVVEDNLRVVRRGFQEVRRLEPPPEAAQDARGRARRLPQALERLPVAVTPAADVHAFWARTGDAYACGRGDRGIADPFAATALIPAATGALRDMTGIRTEIPVWLPEHCTACGHCYAICPDSALPGLVHGIGALFNTLVTRVEAAGEPTRHLRRALREVERRLRALVNEAGTGADVAALLDRAALEAVAAADLVEPERQRLEEEMGRFLGLAADVQLAATTPHWSRLERTSPGSGGLFSLAVNPWACKGCMACVEVCEDGAMTTAPQDDAAVARLRRSWELWQHLPTTDPKYLRIQDLDAGAGALDSLLLDKSAYGALTGGDGACLGCGEKTVIHLFMAAATALMQPRVAAHVAHVRDLIGRLEHHVRLKLAAGVQLDDPEAVARAMSGDGDLTLAALSGGLDRDHERTVIDRDWLGWVTRLLDRLRGLERRYTDTDHHTRAALGLVNATGCSSVWGSTWPYNPYPVPWTSHLFQDSTSMAMGLFEGHMAKMAEGFKAVRLAEAELAGERPQEDPEAALARFSWRDFSDTEFLLCPPVVAVGGDGAMYDIGFQNLSRALASGLPVKVLVLDTQVYSNTGGQACTSGFVGQISDMAPVGADWSGKREPRKEIGLLGMAHRNTFVLQGAVSHVSHLLEGFIHGLNRRGPALFNVYSVCPVEHGVPDGSARERSRLAVESRAYPLLRYDPDAGETVRECLSLAGNPAPGDDWPAVHLEHPDAAGAPLALRLTFADFAAGEARFRKHYTPVPKDADPGSLVPVAEYLDLDPAAREGRLPCVWLTDPQGRALERRVVSAEVIAASGERRAFWRQLRSLTGADLRVDPEAIAARVREDMAARLAGSLLALADAGGEAPARLLAGAGAAGPSPDGGDPAATATTLAAGPAGGAPAGTTAWEPVWIEPGDCTACDECIHAAPGVFAYDAERRAQVTNPRGAPYRDIVTAAERCTAGCIHPGTPPDPGEPDLERWVQRAEAYQ